LQGRSFKIAVFEGFNRPNLFPVGKPLTKTMEQLLNVCYHGLPEDALHTNTRSKYSGWDILTVALKDLWSLGQSLYVLLWALIGYTHVRANRL
jgi:hypothetical protein